MKLPIRSIYFYLVSLISLLIVLFNTSSLVSTGLRYYVFKTTPIYTYQPPFPSIVFPFFGPKEYPIPPMPSLPGEEKQTDQAQELLDALKNNKETTQEQRQVIETWFTDYARWRKEQEDQHRYIVDDLIKNLVVVLLFTPTFYFHFKHARQE